jgi:hypothetical protein
LVEARNVVAQLLGECDLVPGGELWAGEQRIASCDVAPLAGNGRLLDDAGVAVAYGLVDFGDEEQRVGDVQCDVAFGHVAVEQSESGDDHSIGERMTASFGRFVRGVGQSTAGLVGVEPADALVEGQTTESGGQSAVVGDELWAGERKIGSYGGAPLAGHGQLLGDVELVVVDDVGAVVEA